MNKVKITVINNGVFWSVDGVDGFDFHDSYYRKVADHIYGLTIEELTAILTEKGYEVVK